MGGSSIPAGMETVLTSAIQQMAVVVAENVVRDAAVRTALAEHRAAAAENQLEAIKEQAVQVMENVQQATIIKVHLPAPRGSPWLGLMYACRHPGDHPGSALAACLEISLGSSRLKGWGGCKIAVA